MTLTLTVPFVITASILMTLHWYDVMYDSSLEVFAVLSKTRYIGAVVIPIVFIAEMVTGSLRATLGTGDWGYISGSAKLHYSCEFASVANVLVCLVLSTL
jgi:hypothetical protein